MRPWERHAEKTRKEIPARISIFAREPALCSLGLSCGADFGKCDDLRYELEH
jgi:hypothetical protein